MWFLLLSCASPAPPVACDQMCVAAADLYGSCLADWGVGWEGAGYDSEADFLGSCETWGWEMMLLQADATAQGRWSEADWLTQTCTTRQETFSATDATCEDYTDIEWNNVPWAPED